MMFKLCLCLTYVYEVKLYIMESIQSMVKCTIIQAASPNKSSELKQLSTNYK